MIAKTREGLKTVNFPQNALPVLFPVAEGARADGLANFYAVMMKEGSRSDTTPMRVVRDEDLAAAESLLDDDAKHALKGTLQLRQGYQTNDEVLRRKGAEKVWRFHPQYAGADKPVDTFLARELASVSQEFTRLLFSIVVTAKLREVRLVMWFCQRSRYYLPPFWHPV